MVVLGLKMSNRKRFTSDVTYTPDDNSHTDNSSDSDFMYIKDNYSKTDENFSADNDKSKKIFSIQNVRQWCKIFHQLLLHFLSLAILDQTSLWQMIMGVARIFF